MFQFKEGRIFQFVYMTTAINTSLFAILYCSVHRLQVAYNMKTTRSYRWFVYPVDLIKNKFIGLSPVRLSYLLVPLVSRSIWVRVS